MVTNYAKRRVKLRIERAKFQFVLIVFCNRAVLLFNFPTKTMDSDESYQREREFYYPNEEDKENNAEETQPSFTISDVQSYILEQRPENTVKKTNSDLNTWKRYLKGLKELRPRALLETSDTVFPITDLPAGE